MLEGISPIDGRYAAKTKELKGFFSEYALIKYRIQVEIEYFIHLCESNIKGLPELNSDLKTKLIDIYQSFGVEDAQSVKEIEKTTNHDVKAVEYYIKDKFKNLGLEDYLEFVHFGLTSQDINNTATPLLIKDALDEVFYPFLDKVLDALKSLEEQWKGVPMLARTHGQSASPTSIAKEIRVFTERLGNQYAQLKDLEIMAKFGGATGNFNAHLVAYPNKDWIKFGNAFVNEKLGLKRQQTTTQIAHYDQLASIFHAISRINTILIDFCRDIWTYISMDYIGQRTVEGEIGSSAMPHKVNPIDFENAEGNLGMSNAILIFMAGKLPISRLQRDLTDSTVLRNVGVPIAHSLIAFKSILKGIEKLKLNTQNIHQDLDYNWAVVAEAIQSILRREAYPEPYEALKALTRGKEGITESSIKTFIESLSVDESIKEELRKISPHNYIGYS